MRKDLFYIMGLNKGTFSKGFFLILIILMLAALTVTPLFFIAKYMMVLWAFFFFISVLQFRTTKQLRELGLLAITFLFICVLYKIIGVSSAVFGYCITNPFVYFAPIMALIIIEQCDNEGQIRFLFHFISLFVALNILDSIRLTYMLGLDNIAYQQLAGLLSEKEGIGGLNLGGSLFVNMIVFYTNVVFFAFLKTKYRIERILFLTYFGIGAYFIIMCSLKGSAVVLLVVSILLQYVAHRGGVHFGRTVVIFVIIVGLFLVFRDFLIDSLISIIGSDRIASRLEVFASRSRVSDSDTFVARENLWMVSLQSWLQNPFTFLFGIGEHDAYAFSTTAESGVGNHSDLLDVLARYGLVGGVILYSTIKVYYQYLHEKYGSFFRFEIISFFILIVLMGLTKKFIAGEPAIIIFILFPLCLKEYCPRKK